MVCQRCFETEAEMKKRPLCRECYSIERDNGNLKQYKIYKAGNKNNNYLKGKYGERIFDDYKKVISDPNLSLTALALRYGFSRERSRQIFNEINGFKYTSVKNKKSIKRHTDRFMDKVSPEKRVNRHQGKNTHLAAVSELKAYNICKAHGYDVVAKKDGELIDFSVNGFNVEVKSSTHSVRTSKRSGILYYRFHFSRKQADRLDFIACYIFPADEFYVIPKKELPASEYIFIKDKSFIGKKQHECRYHKYREAWHLLNKSDERYSYSRILGKRLSETYNIF